MLDSPVTAAVLTLSLLLQLHPCGFSEQIELHALTPAMDQTTSTTSTCTSATTPGESMPESNSSFESTQNSEPAHNFKSTQNWQSTSTESPQTTDSNPFPGSTPTKREVKVDQTEKNDDQPQKYVGNSFSLKFHKPSCPYARVMRKSRRVSFPYRKAAVDAGQRPCKYCLPPWWLKVEAKLLNHEPQTESTLPATSEPDD
jgi:hypothetical protein